MKSVIKILLAMPKTLLFNLRHLPFKDAIKFPIWLTHDTECHISGKVRIIGTIKPFMIRIGFHECETCNKRDTTKLSVEKGGQLLFDGTAHVGHGSKIIVMGDGLLELGDNFAISASSTINCYKHIKFGKDIQFSWDCLVMDSDTHAIFDEQGQRTNEDEEIIFGDKNWIGCRSTILKRTSIPENCVIGASSFVSGSKFEPNTIIAGHPAKSVRKIGGWKL